MSKTQPPILPKDCFSVLKADINTGHVLQIIGELFLGNGEVYEIFEGLSQALNYVNSELIKNNSIEFVIYDSTGKAIMFINENETKDL